MVTGGRAGGMSVEQLAARTDLPTTTIRLYQTKGVLHPPRRLGRTARYDASHVQRIELVHRLRDRGFSLPAIAELVAARDQGARVADVLGLDTPGGPDDWVPLRLRELRCLVRAADLRPALLRRATRLDLVRWSKGRPYARRWALGSGSSLTALSVPPAEVLDAFERLRAATDAIAADFVEVFERRLWPGLVGSADSAEALDRTRTLLAELTDTAAGVVAGALRESIREQAEAFARRHRLLPDDEPPAWADRPVPVLAENVPGDDRFDDPDDEAVADAIERYLR